MGMCVQGAERERPDPTPELLIELAGFETERVRRGTEWCRRYGVGPRRETLSRAAPEKVVHIAAAGYARAHRGAEQALAAHCKACGGCPWAER